MTTQPTLALQAEAIRKAIDEACSLTDSDIFSWRRARQDDLPHLLRFTHVTAGNFARDLFHADSPYYYSLIQENASSVCGMVLIYVGYSTWDGRVLFFNHTNDMTLALIMLTLAHVAIRLECTRLVWQHTETTRTLYQTMGASTLDEWLTLRMDRTGIDFFRSTQPAALNVVDVWTGPLAANAVHRAIDDSLRPINAVMKETHMRIKRATASDVADIHRLVQELADYEKVPDAAKVTEDQFRLDGFNSSFSLYYCLMVQDTDTGQSCGMALVYFGFDLDTGRFLYLEDLFIEEAFRGRGVGKVVMLALASIAQRLDCGSVVWQALDWNTPALTFYDKIGAKVVDGLLTSRFAGAGLHRFVKSRHPAS